METEARTRGLAGCVRRRALGESVSVRPVAAAQVPSACTRMTARSMNPGAHRAFLIASRQNIKNRANSLTTNEKTFFNR
jgi:hypothetical protein